MVQPPLQARWMEDRDHLSIDREARPRDQRMTGQECTEWLDDQIFSPVDRVHDQADQSARCPD